jgi:hypothetical protein
MIGFYDGINIRNEHVLNKYYLLFLLFVSALVVAPFVYMTRPLVEVFSGTYVYGRFNSGFRLR